MLRIALAGTGAMARVHADAFAAVPDVRIVAVWGRDVRRTGDFAASVGATPYTDLDTLFAASACDVLDCCTATPGHRAIVEAAARHGVHAITEKPLALSLEDAQAMLDTCRVAGVHLLVGMTLRFETEYVALGEAVHTGRIGTPVTATMSRQGSFPIGSGGWYGDATLSGGIFVDLLIHDFDWALSAFGPVASVFARHVDHHGPARLAQGMAILRHANGVLTLITGTWGFPGEFTCAVDLSGTGGLLRYHSDRARPIVTRTVAQTREPDSVPLADLSGAVDPYVAQLSHFVDVIVRGEQPRVTAEQSLDALRCSLAAVRSAQTGRPETMEGTLL